MKVSADYRMLALDALRGKWKTAVLTGIAASALGATIVSSSNSAVSNSNQAKDIHFELFSQPNGGRLLAVLLAGIVLWAVLQLIVGGAVQLGYAHFNLNLVDGNDAAISDLFSQKDRLWDGFCMKFLQGLYIALWSLLLVIPGIVKTYSYAMTPYIMSEHPSLTANEAITESRRIMNGNKWRLFCLDFSFIGWELLCSVPLYAEGFLVLKYFTGSEALAISLVLLLTIPLSIGFFFVHPYEEAAWATSTAILPQHLPNRMKHIDFYIKIIVVVPFIGYDSKWPDQSKHRLKKLIQNANDSIVISHSADVSSYKKRNYYMVDHAEYLIGVFDNQKKLRSGTAQTVNYALHQGKVITLIHPDTMEITAPAP